MRDVTFMPFDEDYELVVSSDNASNIGEKRNDAIHAPYALVAESLFRVAYMENRAVGAVPMGVVLYNFTDDSVWEEFVEMIQGSAQKVGWELPVTGSTESNFPLPYSAFGLTVFGKVRKEKRRIGITPFGSQFAVIGEPLVGNEVMIKRERMASLKVFERLVEHNGVYELVPVGSKGIAYEIRSLVESSETISMSCRLDIDKSAGPASCFVITYDKQAEEAIREIAGDLFNPIQFL